MSIRYKVVKQSFGFDENKTEKYVLKTVTADASAVYRRKTNFTPGKMFKNFLKDVSITRVPEATSSSGNNSGGKDDGDDGWEDPNA